MANETQETIIRISQQRFKLRVWITSRLWAQVMVRMVLRVPLTDSPHGYSARDAESGEAVEDSGADNRTLHSGTSARMTPST